MMYTSPAATMAPAGKVFQNSYSPTTAGAFETLGTHHSNPRLPRGVAGLRYLLEDPSAASEKKRLSHWAEAVPAHQKRRNAARLVRKRIRLVLKVLDV